MVSSKTPRATGPERGIRATGVRARVCMLGTFTKDRIKHVPSCRAKVKQGGLSLSRLIPHLTHALYAALESSAQPQLDAPPSCPRPRPLALGEYRGVKTQQ